VSPIDELDALVAAAPVVPLTGEVRVDRRRAIGLARELQFGAELVQLFEDARRVPLTGQVRIDREQAAALLARARSWSTTE
jgi:hypothetical protein